MAKVYVGGPEVGRSIAKEDLEDKFAPFGRLVSVWVARQPPGFAFIGSFSFLDDQSWIVHLWSMPGANDSDDHTLDASSFPLAAFLDV
jgi:hypothetical protein